ncbi:DNA methyltransferase [Candidatus Spongiihabitans sp.]|uniref:DNA methyltransferase n=1 Tax=Candidatus Spongiihabitans sp. TaxID=3101308 RepID=UPI003C6EB73D
MSKENTLPKGRVLETEKHEIQNMKYEDYSWDFRDADTKELTHCIHAYPAMMIPQIARRLLRKYGSSSDLLFDPYCGSGTSLLEANMKNINAIGTDLNPLARLIADTKTTPIDMQALDLYLKDFHDYSFNFQFNIRKTFSIVIPQFDNINFWFNENAQKKLALIKEYIDNVKSPKIKNFFLTAFSETVRESSLTKKNEFKLVRIPEDKREVFNPDSFGIMLSKLSRNKQGLSNFIQQKRNGSSSKIYDFNTVNYMPKNIVPDKSIDIVITSPPYGDSRTTVAYGQYSRLANQWMGIKNASNIDKSLMGGVKYHAEFAFDSAYLRKTLEKINNKDSKRSKEVESFFIDYKNSIDNVAKTIKRKGIVCYVVGNRTVKDINIPMDLITQDFFENNGFGHLETIIRNIPNKRMPSENSPSNIPGKKSTTMKNEFIVVFEKH